MSAEMSTRLDDYLKAQKKQIDGALKRFLPHEDNYPPVIFEAMGYSLFAGGKRIRPILCLAGMEALGAPPDRQTAALPVACALEMIHTYSLIHDDLPAMDDDDCRRGKPTSHKVFGEDVAILAGDALLTEAFHLMSGKEIRKNFPPESILAVIHEIAAAAGCFGMIGGQVVDVRSEKMTADANTLYYIHTRKTGAMIVASLKTGAILAESDNKKLDSLVKYGSSIGLMFQIVDDILNVEGDRLTTGKSTGSDAFRGKITFPALFGLEASRKKIAALTEQAMEALSEFEEEAAILRLLARHIMERKS